MSWRAIQLGNNLCDQDKLILSLFKDEPVSYIGHDNEFSKLLNCSDSATNLVLIFNHCIWVSDLVDQISNALAQNYQQVYIGINRYLILGNDTTINFLPAVGSTNVLKLVAQLFKNYKYTSVNSGSLDNDRGKHFNFVQPLTWVYGKQ